MMIIFHLLYDLNHFGFVDINLYENPLTQYWRYLIVFLFLSAVGISMVISYKVFNIYKFIKRILLIGSCALLISITTYFIFPDSWVYFGILHLICVSSIITIFFVNKPKISIIIAITILVLNYFNIPDLSFISNFLDNIIPINSIDFYPLFPWLAIVFIGIYMGHNDTYYKKIFTIRNKTIQIMGKNSLIIYILHQVILFSMVAILYTIIKN